MELEDASGLPTSAEDLELLAEVAAFRGALEAGLAEMEAAGEAGGGIAWEIGDWVAKMRLRGPLFVEVLGDARADARIREGLLVASYPDLGARLDGYQAGDLAIARRLDEALAVCDAGLAAFGDDPSSAGYLHAVRADILRRDERWAEALDELELAASLLPGEPAEGAYYMEYEARSRYLGVRVQFETLLGRVDHALAASAADRALASDYVESQAYPLLAEASFDFAAERHVDLMVALGLYDQVVARVDELLWGASGEQGDPGGAAPPVPSGLERLGYLRALARTGLELRGSEPMGRAHAELEELLSMDGLEVLLQVNIYFAKARLERAAEDWPAMAVSVAASGELLAGYERAPGGQSSVREAAAQAALEASFDRLQGASAEQLRQHLLGLEGDVAELLAAWQSTPALVGGVGFLFDERRRDFVGELIELCVVLEEPERALGHLLAIQAQGALSRSLGVAVPSLDELREELGTTGGVLVYLPTLAATHLLVVDAYGVRHHPLPPTRLLRGLVGEVRFEGMARGSLVADEPGPKALELAKELLPRDLRQRMADWTHVYVSGAGMIGDVRFESLPYADGNLGRAIGLSHAPSLPLAVHLAKGTQAPEVMAAGMVGLFAGPPSSDEVLERWPKLGDLDLGDAAWERITEGSPEGVVEIRSGANASRASFVAADLAAMRVLNLFCHGVFDAERDVPAGLVLAGSGADSGLLWWEDIRERAMPPLVVLAACGAARGPTRVGEDGVQHLGGAFLRAGARTVLLSRGDLEASSALELMAGFHAGLAAGLSPMESLRVAREEFAQRHGSDAAVADLFLLGPGHRAPFLAAERPTRSLTGLLIALVLGLGLVGLLVRRRAN